MHFLVAIAYHGGVIVAEPYEKMTGEYSANFGARKLLQAYINARLHEEVEYKKFSSWTTILVRTVKLQGKH